MMRTFCLLGTFHGLLLLMPPSCGLDHQGLGPGALPLFLPAQPGALALPLASGSPLYYSHIHSYICYPLTRAVGSMHILVATVSYLSVMSVL